MITIQLYEQDLLLAIQILVMSFLIGSGSAFIIINYYYRSSSKKITSEDILVCAFGGMLIAFGILYILTQWGVVGIIVR